MAYPAHFYSADIADIMLKEDISDALNIIRNIFNSGSDAPFMIVEDYIQNDPELSRDDDLVQSYRNRKTLTTYGEDVAKKTAELLQQKATAVEQLIMGRPPRSKY